MFSLVIHVLVEEFGGKISKQGVKMKFEALKEYSIEEIQAAGTWILKYRQEKFPPVPTVQEFIDVIETKLSPELSQKSKAVIQADIIIKAIKSHNPDIPVRFKDPITHDIMINQWSMRELQTTTKEADNVWLKKKFIEAYNSYTEILERGEIKNQIENKELLKLANKSTKDMREKVQ